MVKLRTLLLSLLALGMLGASRADAIILASCQNDCNCNRGCSTKCVDDDSQTLLTCDLFICSGHCVAAETATQPSDVQAAWNAIFAP